MKNVSVYFFKSLIIRIIKTDYYTDKPFCAIRKKNCSILKQFHSIRKKT